jgi:DNA-binding transcriptional ArsR family regulator
VGTIGGRREQIEEPSNADVLASLWPDWNYAPVVAVPQLFIEVYLPRLRLAEVKLFLYFCSHIPLPNQSTTPASISVTVQELAASVGLSRDMAMKALRVLEREKLIICDRPGGRRANQYRICWGTFRWRPGCAPPKRTAVKDTG